MSPGLVYLRANCVTKDTEVTAQGPNWVLSSLGRRTVTSRQKLSNFGYNFFMWGPSLTDVWPDVIEGPCCVCEKVYMCWIAMKTIVINVDQAPEHWKFCLRRKRRAWLCHVISREQAPNVQHFHWWYICVCKGRGEKSDSAVVCWRQYQWGVSRFGSGALAQWLSPHIMGSYMGTGSCPGCSTSHLASHPKVN